MEATRDGLVWQKSTYTAGSNSCVEVARDGGECFVRDTKDRTGGQLTMHRPAWAAFLNTATR